MGSYRYVFTLQPSSGITRYYKRVQQYQSKKNNRFGLKNTCEPLQYHIRHIVVIYKCYPGQGWFVRNWADRPKPRCTWKIHRGLGSMSRYSARILICFIAYIFYFFYCSMGLVGNFAGLPLCTVPSAIVHCNQNGAGHQTIKAPSMPSWVAASPWKHRAGEIDRF